MRPITIEGEKGKMKKQMGWLMVILIAVVVAFGLNVVKAADWKYDDAAPDSARNTLQKIVHAASVYYTYTGWARSGASGADACWRVLRMYSQADGVTTSYMYYEGDAQFNAIWNARAAGTYK